MQPVDAIPESFDRIIEQFEYPESPDSPFVPSCEYLWEEAGAERPAAGKKPPAQGRAAAEPGESDRGLAEEARSSFEAGRQRGIEEGRHAEREAHSAARKDAEGKQARQAAQLVAAFATERDRYLNAVEQEVVKLALAVAARILRREAQMDPLLLTGAVRVALGQLAGSTEVRLRVPEPELRLWTEAMALVPNLNLKPAVMAGEGMRLGDCTIETKLGSVDLGIRSQLAEIERGFFDRAGIPAASGAVAGNTAPSEERP